MAASQKRTLRESALQTTKDNPSQLGDPISLKAETSPTSPTPQDKPKNASNFSPSEDIKKVAPYPTEGDTKGQKEGTLRQKALKRLDENPSQLGDPISLKAETADSEPTEKDRPAKRDSKL